LADSAAVLGAWGECLHPTPSASILTVSLE
jgi:hypothetical protein